MTYEGLDTGRQLCEFGRNALELGRFEEAAQAFERAIEIDPKKIAYRALALGATKVLPGNPHVDVLERAAQTPLSPQEALNVAFALGKAYRDLKDDARAFGYVLRGNALKRKLVHYDEAATLQTIRSMPALFTRSFFEQRRGWGNLSKAPVFVVGMPRSGTTLVEQILASHPLVHAAGETRALNESVAALGGSRGAFGAAEIAGADAATIRAIGDAYLERLPERAVEIAHVTDKMPENFVLLGVAHSALPNARIVYVRRDPVDTCLSCFSTMFAEGQAFTYDLAELGRYYRAYETLMRHWKAVLPSDTLLEVRYEHVVDDLEGQARRLLEFCDLPWDEACLRFYETQRPVRTASVMQVRRPIYRSSVGKWRPPEAQLKPLYDALAVK